jgi:hypothetical protein
MDENENRNEIIEQWFRDSFHREPIAQNTEHLNYVRRAVDNLKKRLAAKSTA